ncbi:hypothetical protein [Parabacteroides sp. ZJ-118]|uniref:hypothetical protein n=1 Tax=Parabacteroides sp. ZJ-118 TaxID=2709398 RepID=UPI0013EB541C|nr:hypothetical protein [Parabacteroides sp. ZJ-118]
MTLSQLENISKEFGTPFYLMDGEQYLKNINSFKTAFKSKCDLVIGYSFKTNYVPALCKIAKDAGCYAEVVSEMEYALAKRIGFERIIFNGPIKNESVLIEALKDKAVINLDSLYEVDTVLRFREEHTDVPVSVGLRLNIGLTNDSGVSKIQCDLRVGRFGFPKELIGNVISRLRTAGIKIISLHGHTSSSDRAVANYKIIVRQMLEICETYSLDDLRYFDVGGGFFGVAAEGIDTSGKPTYEDYAECIVGECSSNDWFGRVAPSVVIEPGVSVTANVFSYVSKIFQVKEICGQKFLTTDGTVFDVKPTMHSNNLPHVFYTHKASAQTYLANLVGSTCMEKDVILKDIAVPASIAHGDYVRIDGVGAYTIVLSPTFINYLSPIIELKGGKAFLIRRRQNLEDVMSLYNL